jgi:hypothetical protein
MGMTTKLQGRLRRAAENFADDDRQARDGRCQHFLEEAELSIPDDAHGGLHRGEDER